MKEKAKELAVIRHHGMTYNGKSYAEGHLAVTVSILADFGFVSKEYVASGWLHDSIEDTNTTQKELQETFGDFVADVVWACTGIGHNRKTRNADIYAKIALCPEAAVVKLADRICHVEDGSKREMYRREQEAFEKAIRPHVPPSMWSRLEKAFG